MSSIFDSALKEFDNFRSPRRSSPAVYNRGQEDLRECANAHPPVEIVVLLDAGFIFFQGRLQFIHVK